MNGRKGRGSHVAGERQLLLAVLVRDGLDCPLHRRAEAVVVADGDTGAAGEAPPVRAEEAPVRIVQEDDASARCRPDGSPHDGPDLLLASVALGSGEAAAEVERPAGVWAAEVPAVDAAEEDVYRSGAAAVEEASSSSSAGGGLLPLHGPRRVGRRAARVQEDATAVLGGVEVRAVLQAPQPHELHALEHLHCCRRLQRRGGRRRWLLGFLASRREEDEGKRVRYETVMVGARRGLG
jgi:hypothetical protein